MFTYLKKLFSKNKEIVPSTKKVAFQFETLYKAIGFYPKTSEENYIKALTHASFTKKVNEKNERLEFLGDAALNFLVTEFLYEQFAKKNEGDLSKFRSKIVSRSMLNQIGLKLNLHNYLRHKLAPNFHEISPDIAGNTFEALIGAFYLDYGINDLKPILQQLLFKQIDIHTLETEIKDYKSFLFEWAQAEKKQLKLKLQDKATNSNEFIVHIYIDNNFVAKGVGKSKKEAEKDACYNACNLCVAK